MAIAQHRVLAWVWRGLAGGDMRTGFIEMTRDDMVAAIAQGRAQDPRRTTSLQLKHISNVPFVIPLAAPEPPAQSLGAAATPTRRRRVSSSDT